MLNQAVTYLFYMSVGLSLFFGLINLVLSNVYDIRQTKLRRQRARHPYMRSLRRRPLVSVVVYARNDSTQITNCLQSISQSSYKKLEIIVVDNASVDPSVNLARQFSRYTKLNCRVIAKRTSSNRSQAISQALKYSKGSKILVLDANCRLDSKAIKYAVLNSLHTGSHIIALNNQHQHDYTLKGLADSLKSVLINRIKKSGGLIALGMDSHNYAVLYDKNLLLELLKSTPRAIDDHNALHRSVGSTTYESLAVAYVYGSKAGSSTYTSSNKKLVSGLHIFRNFIGVLEPLLIGFMIYVAVNFNNPGYIVLAWLSFTGILVLAVWSDETKSLLAKARLSLLALVGYSLYLYRLVYGYKYLAHLKRS